MEEVPQGRQVEEDTRSWFPSRVVGLGPEQLGLVTCGVG